MKIVDWLKDILGFGEDDFDDIEINFTSESAESIMESLAKASKKRRTLNMNDKTQREQYVREYCDMMAVASKDVDAQKIEYQQVTERIADLEEFEKLPATDKSQVRIRANKIIKIEQENSSYTRPAKKITEAQYREMEIFTQFSSDLDDVTKKQLAYGTGLMHILRQPQYSPYSQHRQVVLLVSATNKCMQDIDPDDMDAFVSELLTGFESDLGNLCREIDATGQLSDETKKAIISYADKAAADFKKKIG